jgi:Sigma 54 modulation protein / S30EA ribosomal protein
MRRAIRTDWSRTVKIQVNSDKNIAVDSKLTGFIEGEVNRILKRYARRLTRVEIHLSDVNSQKFGTRDKRCRVEARPAGHRPLTASNGAATIEYALVSALTKMRNSLESVFGRIQARQSTAPLKVAAAGASPVAQAEEVEKPVSSGRGQKKKKGVYQARRKSWPRR